MNTLWRLASDLDLITGSSSQNITQELAVVKQAYSSQTHFLYYNIQQKVVIVCYCNVRVQQNRIELVGTSSDQIGELTMKMTPISEIFYRQAQVAFVAVLGALMSLSDQIRRACQEHKDNGFVPYMIEKCRRFRVWAGSGAAAVFFVVQVNPHRLLRKGPTPGIPLPRSLVERHLSRLHPEVIPYTSAWRQYAFPLLVNGRSYVLLPQPWPMGTNHAVLASTEAGDTQEAIRETGGPSRVVGDLCHFARGAQGMLVFWSGSRAGCSIEDACHFQALDRDPDGWALEVVCDRVRSADGGAVVTDPELYPLAAWSFRGATESVVEQGSRLIEIYYDLAGDNATVNLLAVADDDIVTLFVVPRDRRYEAAAFGEGELVVGSLEAFGEIVVEAGPVPAVFCEFSCIFRMLRSVRPANIDELARRFVRGAQPGVTGV